MRNTILISIAILLIGFVILERYIFKEKFGIFKTSISEYEVKSLENFRRERAKKIVLLSSQDQAIRQLFIGQFDESKAIVQRDTTFSFLFLSESIKYNSPSFQYIECLSRKCFIDKRNESVQNKIAANGIDFEKIFGEIFSTWYPRFKDEKLIKITSIPDCSSFFPALAEINVDENAWREFYDFLAFYKSKIDKSKTENAQIVSTYESQKAFTTRQLNSNVIDYFENKLLSRMPQVLIKDSSQETFNSPLLGAITFSINKLKYDQAEFQTIADDAFEEQFKYNSLSNGAMPYSYCYGSSNYCSDYSCSKIQVQTGGSDVLTTIKNGSGVVVRHAYIKAGYSYTFNVPDGEYQVFFYYGSGWNPNKVLTTTSCGALKGGFVTNEEFSKDNSITLYSQIMKYELILQRDGNLRKLPSSESEAF